MAESSGFLFKNVRCLPSAQKERREEEANVSHFFASPFRVSPPTELLGRSETRGGAQTGGAGEVSSEVKQAEAEEGGKGAVNLAQLIQLVRIGRASLFPRRTSYYIFASPPPKKRKPAGSDFPFGRNGKMISA